MASIRKREHATGTTWQIRWRENGQPRSRSFTNYNQALMFRGRVDAAGQRDPDTPTRPANTYTVAQWCTQTLTARSGISERTRRDYLRHLDNHLDHLADMPIAELQRTDIGAWINQLADKLSPKTVKNIHGILSSCLQDAVQDGLLAINHAKGVGLPKIYTQAHEMLIPTRSDFDLIANHLDPHWHPLLATLLGTGTRWGEATALSVGSVNVLTRQPRISVTRAWRKAETGWEIGPPKTRRSVRCVDEHGPG